MRYDELYKSIKDLKKILDMSESKAQFSLYCTLHAHSEFLSEDFRDFLFKLFTYDNLDRPSRALYYIIANDFQKVNSFYNDGKILMNLT